MMMKYHDVEPMARTDAEKALASHDPEAIADALVRLAYFDRDWKWVQDECLRFTNHPDPAIRGVAATCLGHVARIHKKLDLTRVLPVLEKLAGDPDVGGRAQDALEDVWQFVRRTD